jgi:hypothetical protein
MDEHGPHRVAVTVSPRVWGDALSVALRAQNVEVVTRPHGLLGPEPGFSLALTTGEALEGADISVILPTCPETRTARIARPRGPDEERCVGNLDDVLDLVIELLAGRR